MVLLVNELLKHDVFEYINQKLLTLSALLRICWLYPLQKLRTPPKSYPGYDSVLHLMVWLQFWRSGEPIHYCYSNIHSDPEFLSLLGSLFMVQINLIKIFLYLTESFVKKIKNKTTLEQLHKIYKYVHTMKAIPLPLGIE